MAFFALMKESSETTSIWVVKCVKCTIESAQKSLECVPLREHVRACVASPSAGEFMEHFLVESGRVLFRTHCAENITANELMHYFAVG